MGNLFANFDNKLTFIYSNQGVIILGEDDLEKVNSLPIYWIGNSIGILTAALTSTSPATISSIMPSAVIARNSLDSFVLQSSLLPLSKNAGKSIISNINTTIFTEPPRRPEEFLSLSDITPLLISIYNFQAVLMSELPQANIFYVTPKRAYDMNLLLFKGESVLSQDAINSLDLSKNDVIADIREACKCLAFSINTAVGFHIFRAIEAIITKDYFAVLDIKPDEWQKNKNMGNYIKILNGAKVDDKITNILTKLKDNYRNPISHPEEFWDLDKAETAFGFANSVITILIQDIQEIKSRKTSSISQT